MKSRTVRQPISAVIVSIIALLTSLMVGPRGVLAAEICSPTLAAGCGPPWPCVTGNYFDTEVQQRTQSPYPQEADVSITNSNPANVWSFSSGWVALENRNAEYAGEYYIAQVGYDHFYGCQGYITKCNTNGDIFYFVEYSIDNNGVNNPLAPFFFNEALPGGVQSVVKIQRQFTQGGRPNGFLMTWDDGLGNNGSYNTTQDYPGDVTWGPDSVEAGGEVGDYGRGNGSHALGNQTYPVYFGQLEWTGSDGQTYLASPTERLSANEGNSTYSTYYQYMNYNSGYNFYIWDNRCYGS